MTTSPTTDCPGSQPIDCDPQRESCTAKLTDGGTITFPAGKVESITATPDQDKAGTCTIIVAGNSHQLAHTREDAAACIPLRA